jgi:hypothetical protein
LPARAGRFKTNSSLRNDEINEHKLLSLILIRFYISLPEAQDSNATLYSNRKFERRFHLEFALVIRQQELLMAKE